MNFERQSLLEMTPERRLPITPFVVIVVAGVALNGLAQLDARQYAAPVATIGALALLVIVVAVGKCALALTRAFNAPNALLNAITRRGAARNEALTGAPTDKPLAARRWIKSARLSRRVRASRR